jgi:tripartite-type tricarboxylate transporter receptor subunit TctC
MELFKSRAGFSAVHIPYKGSAGLVNDLLAGQVDVAFLPVHQALQHVRAGKMQMLAGGGGQRTAVTPDIPSLEEASGIKDVDVDMWYALYLPAGTPADIVTTVNREVNAILKMPDVQRTLSSQGLQATGSTPEFLADLTRKDLARWAEVIRSANLQAD